MKPKQDGFTLVEILIVIMIVVILAVVALFVFNPAKQRYRVWDIQRKRELEQLRILYENYFSEHLRYPTDQDVCYDTAVVDANGTCSCHICGLEKDPGTFASLLHKLYCDPEHGRKDYLYTYDCTNGANPLWYVTYGQLSTGAGAEAGLTCNYAVASDRTRIVDNAAGCLVQPGPSPTPGGGSPAPTVNNCPADPIPKYCRLSGICNICGDYSNCLNPSTCDQPPTLFQDSGCNTTCQGSGGGGGPTSTPIPTPTSFQLGSCPIDPDPKYCFISGVCNNCGSYASCTADGSCDDPLVLYGNDTCNAMCYSE